MSNGFTAIDPGSFAAIVARAFGSAARVDEAEEIRPAAEHGIARVIGCTQHVSMRFRIAGDPQPYLLRLSRAADRDRFDHEALMYGYLSRGAGLPVPRIHVVDRTRAVVPTAYLIRDWLAGDHWVFLSHPGNPATDGADKREIMTRTGRAYAAIHGVDRPAADPAATFRAYLDDLTRFERAVDSGVVRVDRGLLRESRAALEAAEALLRVPRESLGVADAEVHFVPADGGWRVSGMIDVEWMGFWDPYWDLVWLLTGHLHRTEVREPLSLEGPLADAVRPVFEAYAGIRPIDRARLARVVPFVQFVFYCGLAGDADSDDMRSFVRQFEPLYDRLMRTVIAGRPDAAG